MEQPKVWCLVMVVFVFVRVYFLHLFSDHAAVFSKVKLMNRKLCTSWFVTVIPYNGQWAFFSYVFSPLNI